MLACQVLANTVNVTLGINLAGFIGNTSGNTMGCRLYHIQAAVNQSDASHCSHASIHGGGVCVSPTTLQTGPLPDACTTWCSLVAAACPDMYGGTYTTYGVASPAFNATACGIQCATVYGIPYTPTQYPVPTVGDSMACHQYHAVAANVYAYLASSSERIAHCSHASPLGGGVCSNGTSPQRVFCNEAKANCPGRFPYSSDAHCISDAGNYSVVDIGTQFGVVAAGDSLACRFYHGGLPSITDPVTHCPHTAWASQPCGDRPTTAAPTTAAPTTATSGASSFVLSVFVVLAALLIAF